jgi:hypothetical protein
LTQTKPGKLAQRTARLAIDITSSMPSGRLGNVLGNPILDRLLAGFAE